MNIFNQFLNFIFDVIFLPFTELSPEWGLILVSLLTGVLMLIIFKHISDQEGIRIVKNQVKAHLLELRLYKDDASLSIKAIRDIFRKNFKYMAYALKPMIVLMIPVIIILIQVATRYEFRPVKINDSTIISVKVISGVDLSKVSLETPSSIKQEAPPVRVPANREIHWRINATKAGTEELLFKNGSNTVNNRIVVGDSFTSLAPKRFAGFSFTSILYPAATLLPGDSFIKEISLRYPKRHTSIFGFQIHWLIIFFIFSILSGFALKGVFKVEI